ncbi:MAG: hypothetical protein C5B59_17260 [Bacteroidetes bacterium]|nr:MAG: hypothetical protein C5B59_17260 [Bacteroidota bacterium]
MTAIAAANVTVTTVQSAPSARGGQRMFEESRKNNLVKIVFGDGSLTYPTGGIPMPAIGNFGMRRFLEYISILSDNLDAFIYKWDFPNQKIRIYYPTQQTGGAGNRAGVEFGVSDVPALNTTLYAEAVGW